MRPLLSEQIVQFFFIVFFWIGGEVMVANTPEDESLKVQNLLQSERRGD